MLITIKTALATNLKSTDYVDPERYATLIPSVTNLQQGLSTIDYTIYLSPAELANKQMTVVFDKQSEERVRTQNANKQMAAWINR